MNENRKLGELEPQEVFYFFEELTKIPHGSGNEKAVSDYLMELSGKRGLNATQDEAYNVIINMPASPGYENRKKIILQAHMDMVCQKDEEVAFDFEKDPLDIYMDGEFVRARHTSLGADDGAGVALMLAVMNSETLRHPELQLIFTTGEEKMLIGAKALDGNLIDGDYFIGLDCSSDSVIVVSCAGISVSNMVLPCTRSRMADPASKMIFLIRLEHLQSGHSGNVIHLERMNAIKLMSEILNGLAEQIKYSLCSISCKGLINVIAKSANATICCEMSDAPRVQQLFLNLADKVQNAYRRVEPTLEIKLESRLAEEGETCYSDGSKARLLSMLELLPFGANTMVDDKFTMPESSSNVGAVTEENERVTVALSIRSNSEYQHDVLLCKCRTVAALVGAQFHTEGRASAWEFNPHSRLMEKVKELYREANHEEPMIKQTHSTVEAAVFLEKMCCRGRKLDVVNIGCSSFDVHSVEERLEIASVGRTYHLLRTVIEELE